MDRSVVVISGGSRGLGLRLVQHFLATEQIVVTFSRKASPEIQELITTVGRSNLYFESLDLADVTQLHDFVMQLRRSFGRIDVLINNAAIANDGLLATLPISQIEQSIDVNVKGTLVLTREVLRTMLTQGSGKIINISSVSGLRGYSGLVAYGTTKGAMEGLTKNLAREVGSRGITVNGVAPGFIDTDMSRSLGAEQRRSIVRRTPLGRLGSVDDIVPLVAFLASDQARFITGQTIVVDGGLTT